jgi:hypothetical protein
MSFNATIPIGTNPMLQSQGQCRANFQAINAVFSENHIPMNTTGNSVQGMHSLLLFREQSGATPDPVTSSSQIALYTKAVSSISALFFAPNNTQSPIQLTYPSISTGLQSTDPDVYLPQQYSFVAGPFVIYGGLLTNVTNGSTITLSPTSTLIYAGLVMLSNTIGILQYGIPQISGSGFTVQYVTNSSPNKPSFYYLAIGQ